MVINRLGVLSVGKIMGCVYGLLGIIPAFFAFVFLSIGSLVVPPGNNPLPPALGFGVGIAALAFLPIFYGIMGFIGGVVTSALYNLLASFIGGIEVELSLPPGQHYEPGPATPLR